MRALFTGLVLLFAAAPAAAQTPVVNYFYCYAPDPGNRTVYLSQTLPVGPITERAKYGEEFVAYLRAQGTIKQKTQGYCVMRATADEIAQGQLALSRDGCGAHCLGAKTFTSVYWPRINTPNTPNTPPTAAETALQNVTPPPGPIIVPEEPAKDPLMRVVVMGNDITGEVLVGQGGFNLEKTMQERAAQAAPQTGWRTLLASQDTGHGAAVCVDDGRVNFFAVHGKETLGEAALAAYDAAKPLALKIGKRPFICKHWQVATVAQMNAPDLGPDGVIGHLNKIMFDLFGCETNGDGTCVEPTRRAFVAIGVRG